MAFKRLNPESFDDLLEGLPWANKWRQQNKEDSLPRVVIACQVYDSGIMVVTSEYKGYIHEGTTTYDHLLEALDVWVAEVKRLPSLKVVCKAKGKLELGIDDEEECKYWFRTESRYVQVFDKEDDQKKPEKVGNPLLGGSGVQPTTGKRGGRPRNVGNEA